MSNGRADIRRSDVFISWTGKDHAIKEQIYAYLSANGISCLESDESCSGDYRQWSREAVGACSIFLLILTEHTAASTYVPKEIEALKALPNWQNRVVPVCTDMALYQEQSFGLHASESAVILDGREPSEQHLAQILHKTRDLLTDHLYEHYCEQTKPNYIKLMPLGAAGMAADKQFAYADLYISRSVTELDAAGQEKECKKKLFLQRNSFLFWDSFYLLTGTRIFSMSFTYCLNVLSIVIRSPTVVQAWRTVA